MKPILFDIVATQPFGSNKRHGGGKYGEIVLSRMLERNIPLACYYDSRKWLNPDTLKVIKDHKAELYDISKTSIDDLVKATGCKVIYSALPQMELFNYQGCKVVCTVHGLRTLETPADSYCFLYKNIGWKSWVAFFAKKILPTVYKNALRKYKLREWNNPKIDFVTVSNHSACAIKAYFPEMRERDIKVFYSPSTSSATKLDYKYKEKFFMLVSANRCDKNNLRAIKALDKLFSEGHLSDYRVKITGATDANNYRYSIKNRQRFDFLGFVDEAELDQLYHDAYALVYPSLNEGFGYPPLESMHYGVPVIASPYTSIPEICEGAAVYFNPFSIDEIAARLIYIDNKRVHDLYSERSYAQYEKITAKQKHDLDALVDYISSM